MSNSLDVVKAKVARAEAHLATLRKEVQAHKSVCTVIAKKHANEESVFDLYANFPDPDLKLSRITGDCIENLRAALNCLVDELTSRNGEPVTHTVFPICNTNLIYRQKVERNRLRNVPSEAQVIIESLQPYNAKGGRRFSHPLYILNKMINAHKHQLIALTVKCRAQPVFVLEGKDREEVDGKSITETLQDGARLANQNLAGIQSTEAVMRIHRGLYLPFKDLPWRDSSVETVLTTLVWYVKNQVLPRFDPFFEQRSEGSVYSVSNS